MNKTPFLIPLLVCTVVSAHAGDTTFSLARELLDEKDYPLAAVEFRRFAMETEVPEEVAASYLYAGYAYLQAGKTVSTREMLDRAELADTQSLYGNEVALLNAERAYRARDPESALYFYDLLAEPASPESLRTFALRRSAAIHCSRGDLEDARRQLGRLPDGTASLQALDAYAGGQDKSPYVGGLLGLIPGAGYWYSGEIANGFRSLILNALFIYGMAHTAYEDQWGAFAAISFFEVTWYTGSIYGGVDAAQRYNNDRLDAALQGIEGDLRCQPNPQMTLPIFKLKIDF
jgi:hypothetical protein